MGGGISQTPTRWQSFRRTIWLFCKAQLSSYVASVVDFLVTILLAKVFGVFYVYATFTGSVVGGITNCSINYSWVFRSCHVKMRHVAIKYLLVWAGSLTLNTYGTYFLTEWLTDMPWVNDLLGRFVGDLFILAKLVVAGVVAFFWNYQLQRVFVFRNYDFRRLLDLSKNKRNA